MTATDIFLFALKITLQVACFHPIFSLDLLHNPLAVRPERRRVSAEVEGSPIRILRDEWMKERVMQEVFWQR
jgi:hypothetical protein